MQISRKLVKAVSIHFLPSRIFLCNRSETGLISSTAFPSDMTFIIWRTSPHPAYLAFPRKADGHCVFHTLAAQPNRHSLKSIKVKEIKCVKKQHGEKGQWKGPSAFRSSNSYYISAHSLVVPYLFCPTSFHFGLSFFILFFYSKLETHGLNIYPKSVRSHISFLRKLIL